MKIQYLGTGGSEGIPALMCTCDNCAKARKVGGRALRTRSQALVDDKLLIDFTADTLAHTHSCGIDLSGVTDCLVTHNHYDHFHPVDLANYRPTHIHTPQGWHITFYGSEAVGEEASKQLGNIDAFSFELMKEFVPVKVGDYAVTPLKAVHSANSGPLIYQISNGEKTMLYGTDTNYFHESVWEYWAKTKPYFNMVTLDCTNSCKPLTYVGHMGLAENIKVRERMIEMGIADKSTLFVCTHFSHNGITCIYEELVPVAEEKGFIISYDGMILYI